MASAIRSGSSGSRLDRSRRECGESIVFKRLRFFDDLASDEARRPGGRSFAGQGAREPKSSVAVHDARRPLGPDHELDDGSDEEVAPSEIRPGHVAVEAEEEFGLVPAADPVRKDVAPQPLHFAEADPLLLPYLVGELGQRNVGHVLMPPRLSLGRRCCSCLASTFAQAIFLRG